jgi:hypothetical protein
MCTRETLTKGTQALAAALTAGDIMKLPLGSAAAYLENLATSAPAALFKSPLKLAHQRDFLDVMQCQSFSEVVVTEGTAYVLGIRLKQTADGKITGVTALVADSNDWHFDAATFLTTTKSEDWSVVPEAMRPTRAAAIAAGNAYFDSFNDTTIKPPYGPSCIRLEGLKEENVACNEKLPPPCKVLVSQRENLFDDTLGTAVFFDKFRGLPDSHSFRVVGGKITNMHAIIICDPNCDRPTMPDPGLASCVPPAMPSMSGMPSATGMSTAMTMSSATSSAMSMPSSTSSAMPSTTSSGMPGGGMMGGMPMPTGTSFGGMMGGMPMPSVTGSTALPMPSSSAQ